MRMGRFDLDGNRCKVQVVPFSDALNDDHATERAIGQAVTGCGYMQGHSMYYFYGCDHDQRERPASDV